MKTMFFRKMMLGWLLLTLLGIPFQITQAKQTSAPEVLLMRFSGAVTPAMELYIQRGIARADQMGVDLVVFELNTPGGQVDIMNNIVQDIRASKVPVAVYVSPRGAMAASAGALITLAGHAAAMAPETIIGAASPVGSQGEDIGETMEAKTKEALMATVRTLTANRSPEAVKLAQEMVETARAVSAQEALEAGVIDFIAVDVDDLLAQLNGYTVLVLDQEVVLNTSGAVKSDLPSSLIEQILATLTNPNIVFILLSIGVQAILIELSSPGGWVAGFIGVVCIALAIYGLGVLPVNWFGLLFIVIAFVLFILELKTPTAGALTAAGAASFIVGALVLFNSPSVPNIFRVSVPLVVVTGILTAALFFVIVGFVLKAQKTPIRIGRESLIERTGIVKKTLNPLGSVYMDGELWTAESIDGSTIPANAYVKVIQVQGLKVLVKPVERFPKNGQS